MKEENLLKHLIIGASTVISVSGAGNAYFVSRLVDKLDSVDQRVYSLSADLAVLKQTILDQRGLHGTALQKRGGSCGFERIQLEPVRLPVWK